MHRFRLIRRTSYDTPTNVRGCRSIGGKERTNTRISLSLTQGSGILWGDIRVLRRDRDNAIVTPYARELSG